MSSKTVSLKKKTIMGNVNYSFNDKVVLVTGGTSGIGLETAKKFLEYGAKVVITGRDADKGREVCSALGAGSITFFRADQGEPSDVENLFKAIREGFGRLDIAINNAADHSGVGKPLHDFTLEEYDHALAVNLRGYWMSMKYEIKQMLAQVPSGGTIVNVSSLNGLGGAPGGAVYSAAKAGIIALTKSSAYELATIGVRINALVPGANSTPMLENALASQASTDEQKEAVRNMYLGMIPQKRFADPGESAEAILWLSSEASSYVTGHSLIVDGGTSSLYR